MLCCIESLFIDLYQRLHNAIVFCCLWEVTVFEQCLQRLWDYLCIHLFSYIVDTTSSSTCGLYVLNCYLILLMYVFFFVVEQVNKVCSLLSSVRIIDISITLFVREQLCKVERHSQQTCFFVCSGYQQYGALSFEYIDGLYYVLYCLSKHTRFHFKGKRIQIKVLDSVAFITMLLLRECKMLHYMYR